MSERQTGVPFPTSASRRVVVIPDSGGLRNTWTEEMARLANDAPEDADVVFVSRLGAFELFERVARANPNYPEQPSDHGEPPLDSFDYDFSIRIDLVAIDPRAATRTESQIVRWLDLLFRLAIRSAREICRNLPSACPLGKRRPEGWILPIEPFCAPQDNEIIFGCWTELSANDVADSHEGLLRWTRKVLTPLSSCVGQSLARRWDVEPLTQFNIPQN